MSVMPAPMATPLRICGQGDVVGEEVHANQKRPVGRSRAPTNTVVGG